MHIEPETVAIQLSVLPFPNGAGSQAIIDAVQPREK
jgi:hypothetical protein